MTHSITQESIIIYCQTVHYILTKSPVYKLQGGVMVVIVWSLDLQLPVQSVPIITKVVSSNPVHG